MLKYQNIKTFLQKAMFQISLQKNLLLKKKKNTVSSRYVFSDLNRTFGTFYEKELQKTNKKEFRIKKMINRNGDKLYVKWKG